MLGGYPDDLELSHTVNYGIINPSPRLWSWRDFIPKSDCEWISKEKCITSLDEDNSIVTITYDCLLITIIITGHWAHAQNSLIQTHSPTRSMKWLDTNQKTHVHVSIKCSAQCSTLRVNGMVTHNYHDRVESMPQSPELQQSTKYMQDALDHPPYIVIASECVHVASYRVIVTNTVKPSGFLLITRPVFNTCNKIQVKVIIITVNTLIAQKLCIYMYIERMVGTMWVQWVVASCYESRAPSRKESSSCSGRQASISLLCRVFLFPCTVNWYASRARWLMNSSVACKTEQPSLKSMWWRTERSKSVHQLLPTMLKCMY